VVSSQTTTVSSVFRNDTDRDVDPNTYIEIDGLTLNDVEPTSGYLAEGPGNVYIKGRAGFNVATLKTMVGRTANALFAGSFENDAIEDFIAVRRGQGGATITDRLNATNLVLSANTTAERQTDFDGTTDVNTTTDRITATAHGWYTGQSVIYRNGGNPDIGGLTGGNTVFAIRVDANTIELATSKLNAWAGTQINLTATAAGTHAIHSMERGLLANVSGTPAQFIISVPVTPPSLVQFEFWYEQTGAGAATWHARYGKIVVDEDGAADVIAETSDLNNSSTLGATTYAYKNMDKLWPAPAWATHAFLMFDVGVLDPNNLRLDDIVINVN